MRVLTEIGYYKLGISKAEGIIRIKSKVPVTYENTLWLVTYAGKYACTISEYKEISALPKTILDSETQRELVLLRATYQLLKQQQESPFVLNMLEQSTIWDEARCDGYCLMEEIEGLLVDKEVDVDFMEEDCNA